MSNLKKWFVYLAFLITATVFLIYYLFPSELVKRYIIFKISQINPDLEVSIGDVFPTFPPGLKFDTVSFEYAGNRMLEAEKMRVVPRLATLLRVRKTLLFSLNTYSGSVIGKTTIIARRKNGQFDMEAIFSGMQLADIPVIKNQSAFKLSGVLKMEISYQNRPKIGSTMRARMEILDTELQSENLFLNQGFMAFERIEAYLIMRDRRIDLESCNFTGDQFDGMLSGFGVLKNPVNKSIIELSGRLNPHHPFLSLQDGNLPPAILNALKSETEDIPILIRGSIENLSFSFE
jgi:type II secretion system protein N